MTQIIQAVAACGVKSLKVFESGAFEVQFADPSASGRQVTTGWIPAIPKPPMSSIPEEFAPKTQELPNPQRLELERLAALEALAKNPIDALGEESGGE